MIICVPTRLNKNREPDISYILKTGESIASSLRKGTVVVLESTTYFGTTTEALRPVLETNRNFEGNVFRISGVSLGVMRPALI